LEETQDIAAYLGKNKLKKQVLIGFALETDSEEENARGKMERKNMDMIVLNSLRDTGAGFSSETNKITLIWPDNKKQSFGLKSKSEVANDIVAEVIKLVSA
jgi:phosphopantothenoylcysteine decarboxylase/phosphopantothenate--cysteine ligase